MKLQLVIMSICLFGISAVSLAHEGHGSPGATPLPLIPGGKIKEAIQERGTTHAGVELYFELHFKKDTKKILLYPRVMPADQKENRLHPTAAKDLGDVVVEAKFNRPTQTVQKLTFSVGEDVFETQLSPPSGATRAEIFISTVHEKVKKVAKFTDVSLR